jgi:hypothetical protein
LVSEDRNCRAWRASSNKSRPIKVGNKSKVIKVGDKSTLGGTGENPRASVYVLLKKELIV